MNVLASAKAIGIDTGLLLRQRDRRTVEASIMYEFEVN